MDLSAFGQFPCFLNESIESRASQFSMSSKVRLFRINAYLAFARRCSFTVLIGHFC